MIAVNEKDIKYLREILKGLEVKIFVKRNVDIFVNIEKGQLIEVLNRFKLNNFSQLTLITCIDLIKDNKFKLVYILYSIEKNIEVFITTTISRDKPEIDSIINIYPNALGFEMEIAEMFGVVVNGNNRAGKPFVLENWKEIPPLRKDFDSIAFVNENYIFRERRGIIDG